MSRSWWHRGRAVGGSARASGCRLGGWWGGGGERWGFRRGEGSRRRLLVEQSTSTGRAVDVYWSRSAADVRARRVTASGVVRMDARFSVGEFRAARDPAALAGELEVELTARLCGVAAAAIEDEIGRLVAELCELGHGLVGFPPGDRWRWYGAAGDRARRCLAVSFGIDDETDEGFALVRYDRARRCPECDVPLEHTGCFEIRAKGHGMMDCPAVRIDIEGPSAIRLEVGGRDRVAQAGMVWRCRGCRGVFWQDGELRASPL